MQLVLNLLVAVVIATVTGLGSAWLVIGEEWLFPTYRVGEWAAWPEGGSSTADPYSRALLARTGQLPLGSGEGIAFFAARDSEGRRIRGECDYLLYGEAPQARLWTLGLLDSAGNVPPSPTGRIFFHSREILRKPDGRFEITLSPNARPGNWLPIPEKGSLTIVMRLYDTPVANVTTGGTPAMPTIERRICR